MRYLVGIVAILIAVGGCSSQPTENTSRKPSNDPNTVTIRYGFLDTDWIRIRISALQASAGAKPMDISAELEVCESTPSIKCHMLGGTKGILAVAGKTLRFDKATSESSPDLYSPKLSGVQLNGFLSQQPLAARPNAIYRILLRATDPVTRKTQVLGHEDFRPPYIDDVPGPKANHVLWTTIRMGVGPKTPPYGAEIQFLVLRPN